MPDYSGNDDRATQPISLVELTGSGSLTAAEQSVALTLAGAANVAWQLTGTWVGTVSFEASNDNTNWVAIWAYQAGTGTIVQDSTVNGVFRNTTAGFAYVRARCSAYSSGTIVVTGVGSQGTSGVFINFPQYGPQQLGKQEDAASATSDTGVPAMAVRKATPADLSGTDGDYEPLQMSGGKLWVDASVTATVHPAGLSTVVDGRKVVTTAGTAVQFDAQACKAVAITAETDNTGVVVVGSSTVVAAVGTRRGLPLAAGDTGLFEVSNMNVLWLDSTVNGDGTTWVVLS